MGGSVLPGSDRDKGPLSLSVRRGRLSCARLSRRAESGEEAHLRTCAPAHLRTCAPAHLRAGPAQSADAAVTSARAAPAALSLRCGPLSEGTQRGRVPTCSVPSHLAPSPQDLGLSGRCSLSLVMATLGDRGFTCNFGISMTPHSLALGCSQSFFGAVGTSPAHTRLCVERAGRGRASGRAGLLRARDAPGAGAGKFQSRAAVTVDTGPVSPQHGRRLLPTGRAGRRRRCEGRRRPAAPAPASSRPPRKAPGPPHCTAPQSTAQGHRA